MRITSLEELEKIDTCDEIELPPFKEGGKPFCVKAKKPNMMQLITTGKIPNSLLSIAMDLFNGKMGELANKSTKNDKALKEIMSMMNVLTEVCLVEPSVKDIENVNKKRKENNLEPLVLTEEQLLCILTYSQNGVKALESFRSNEQRSEDNKSSK
ncbi:Uncharacterised protein [uncultured Clostridium sp.]|nr:Uncharacterised protein [uncultured Clostridium sp.]SCI95337.1 Uncharacterised protein [uncultured Clostridium sp.]